MGYLDGFAVTIGKWFGVNSDSGRRVTGEYPEQTRPKPERFHGRHVLNRYEDGMEKCIGCELCAGVCPAQCIYVRGQDNDPLDPTSPGERFGYVYEINYLRCIHCDLCVEACPTQAITETKLFEFSFTNRQDAIYTKAELLVDDDGKPQQLPWEHWDGNFDAAADTSGWMRATSPSGSAEFVGIVAWADELGYGVRPPQQPLTRHESNGHDDHGHDDHGDDDHGKDHDNTAHNGAATHVDDTPVVEEHVVPEPVVETPVAEEPTVDESSITADDVVVPEDTGDVAGLFEEVTSEEVAEAATPDEISTAGAFEFDAGESTDTDGNDEAPPARPAGFFEADTEEVLEAEREAARKAEKKSRWGRRGPK